MTLLCSSLTYSITVSSQGIITEPYVISDTYLQWNIINLRNDINPAICHNLKDILLSEINQRQNNKYYII